MPGSWVCCNRLLLEALGCPGRSACLSRLAPRVIWFVRCGWEGIQGSHGLGEASGAFVPSEVGSVLPVKLLLELFRVMLGCESRGSWPPARLAPGQGGMCADHRQRHRASSHETWPVSPVLRNCMCARVCHGQSQPWRSPVNRKFDLVQCLCVHTRVHT